MLDLRPNERVLDVGCGIGEPIEMCDRVHRCVACL